MIEIYRDWIEHIQQLYADPVDRQRAVGLTSIFPILLVLWGLSLLAFILPAFSAGGSIATESALVYIAVPALFYGIHRLIQSGDLRTARYVFLGFLVFSTYIPMFDGLDTGAIILLAIPLITAGLLLTNREFLIFLFIFNLIAMFIAYNVTGLNAESFRSLSFVVLSSTVVLLLLRLFSDSTNALIRQAQQGIQRMNFARDFNNELVKARDENSAMIILSDLVADKLLYSYLQLHLFDNNRRLTTHVRTGMGTRFSVTPTDLNMVEDSAVRVALESRKPVVIRPQDPPVRRLHMLPSVTHGMIIPLIYGNNETLGLLDVQTNQADSPFNQSEQALLQVIAQEFTNRLKSIREMNLLNQILNERNEAATRLEVQIAKLTQRFEQSSGTDWRDYIESRGANAFGFNLQRDDMLLTPANDLPENLYAALANGEMVIQPTDTGQVINVPITLRGVVLGAMSFAVPQNYIISDRQKDMVRIVAQRLALALENARLIEQSRSQAEREHTASEVSNLLIGQQDLNALLDVAAESFNEALGAIYTHIYLEPDVRQTEFVNGEAR